MEIVARFRHCGSGYPACVTLFLCVTSMCELVLRICGGCFVVVDIVCLGGFPGRFSSYLCYFIFYFVIRLVICFYPGYLSGLFVWDVCLGYLFGSFIRVICLGYLFGYFVCSCVRVAYPGYLFGWVLYPSCLSGLLVRVVCPGCFFLVFLLPDSSCGPLAGYPRW